MFDGYSGATRLIPILGDPIAQVKAPSGLTGAFRDRGQDRIVVPMHVPPDALPLVLRALDTVRNVDGVIATVPHKFAAFQHAASASERAMLLGSANVLRRTAGGAWHADMLDGLSMVRAIQDAGSIVAGKRALLVGAGGAGSAIGLELLNAGAARLAVHDADRQRRDALLDKLRRAFPGMVDAGSRSPAGFDLVVNATSAGMRDGDPPPLRLEDLGAGMFVADVITVPEVTPLLMAAHAIGCRTQTGVGMFLATLELMVDFFAGAVPR